MQLLGERQPFELFGRQRRRFNSPSQSRISGSQVGKGAFRGLLRFRELMLPVLALELLAVHVVTLFAITSNEQRMIARTLIRSILHRLESPQIEVALKRLVLGGIKIGWQDLGREPHFVVYLESVRIGYPGDNGVVSIYLGL